MTTPYTTQLGAGLGLVEETRVLLDLWQVGMDGRALYLAALESGRFPNVSARRLRNMTVEGFKPRYLVNDAAPARLLKALQGCLSGREFTQLLFLYTCRANGVLADFVREVYWPTYAAGRTDLSNVESQAWVKRANQDGKTSSPWSANMVERVAQYVTGCCHDFGLLEATGKRVYLYRLAPYRIEPRVAAILAYDLRLAGRGDNLLLADPDWALFGLDRDDVLNELKRLALTGLLIVQSAGGVTRISWKYDTLEELTHALAEGRL